MPAMASRAMAEAAGSPHEPSSLAWQQGNGRVLVRIEGSPASVEARRKGLQDRLQAFGAVDDLRDARVHRVVRVNQREVERLVLLGPHRAA